jgi:hypothetical protein
VDDVVSGIGIIVRISEDKLELEVVCVIFAKCTLRGRLRIMSAQLPSDCLGVSLSAIFMTPHQTSGAQSGK